MWNNFFFKILFRKTTRVFRKLNMYDSNSSNLSFSMSDKLSYIILSANNILIKTNQLYGSVTIILTISKQLFWLSIMFSIAIYFF